MNGNISKMGSMICLFSAQGNISMTFFFRRLSLPARKKEKTKKIQTLQSLKSSSSQIATLKHPRSKLQARNETFVLGGKKMKIHFAAIAILGLVDTVSARHA